MIIVRLQGGLGNQMFQYAFGKALSLEYNSQLYVDISFLKASQTSYEGFTPRQYELSIFETEIKIASPKLLSDFENPDIIKKVQRIFGLKFKKCYHESAAAATEQLKVIVPPVLLIGYWQSENYFEKFEAQVKKEFAFAQTSEIDANVMKKIHASNSVSVHIRRGDYITNPVARDVIGVLDKEYYLKAFDVVNRKIPEPFYFFFQMILYG